MALISLSLIILACDDSSSNVNSHEELPAQVGETSSATAVAYSSSSSSVGLSSDVGNAIAKSSSSSDVVMSSSGNTDVSSGRETVNMSSDSSEQESSSSEENGNSQVSFLSAGSEYNENKNTLKDLRNGKSYRTVKIGEQVWMAENLNFAYLQKTAKLDSSSFCYENVLDNCEKYGRLYLWSAAMDSAGLYSSAGKGCGYKLECMPKSPIQGVCPEGWHLPDTTEWNKLIASVGGIENSGKMLKSTTGWVYGGTGDFNGTDDYAFTALPAGELSYSVYGYMGSITNFWSSTGKDEERSYTMTLESPYIEADLSKQYRYHGFSVRCVKD